MANEINQAKTDAKVEILAPILTALTAAGLAPVQVGAYTYAVRTSQTDDVGNTICVTVALTAKGTKPTKTAAAFDIEAAHNEYVNGAEASAEKAAAKKEKNSAKAEADKAKREETAKKNAVAMEAIKNFMVNVTAPMTCNEIKAAVPELETYTTMAVGTLMKQAVEQGYANLEMVDKKKCYKG